MKQKLLTILLLVCSIMNGCHTPEHHIRHKERLFTGNAIYHWKGGFDLSQADSLFLRQYQVERIYLRFFDVVEDLAYGAVPNSTVVFKSAIPDSVEIVPTVFITLEALYAMEGNEIKLAENIAKRVIAMTKGNKIDHVREVQVDCDWTENSESSYFRLCEQLRKKLLQHNIELSSTIRLHQLSTQAPPVRSGVLMLYNTGSIRDIKTENSILSYDVVKQYLKDDSYDLPLDFAYPAFSWGVVFSNGHYDRLLHDTDFLLHQEEESAIMKKGENRYKVKRDINSLKLYSSDEIRYEHGDPKEIKKVKSLIKKLYGDEAHSSIIYHLDEKELSRYTNQQIQQIYE